MCVLTVVLSGAAEKNLKFSFVECVEEAGIKSGLFRFTGVVKEHLLLWFSTHSFFLLRFLIQLRYSHPVHKTEFSKVRLGFCTAPRMTCIINNAHFPSEAWDRPRIQRVRGRIRPSHSPHSP